jgi:hypothetical protein
MQHREADSVYCSGLISGFLATREQLLELAR